MKLPFVLVVFASVCLDCTVHAGLANAPALGATPPGIGGVHDAISNGRDSCERRGLLGSPLRGHQPPCPGESSNPPPTTFTILRTRQADGWIDPVLMRWPVCRSFLQDEKNSSFHAPRPVWSELCPDDEMR